MNGQRQDSEDRDGASLPGSPSGPTPVGLGGGAGSSQRAGLANFFSEHAISAQVADARPYVRWTTDNIQPVKDAYKTLTKGQRAHMSRVAGQADGWVITRHAPPGLDLRRVYAEIRPDEAVRAQAPYWHCHPTSPGDVEPVYPTTGNPLLAKDIHTAESMKTHIARTTGDEYVHEGVNDETVHMHQPLAKYVFPSSFKRQITGRDGHLHWVKDTKRNLAKRIDVHPLAVELFADSEIVYFGLEGCIKADAILTAILAADDAATVFSVPSVTLWPWDAPELPRFAAKYLKGKTVIIVPDLDWYKNPGVYTQAMLARTFLRRRGIEETHIEAPPIEFFQTTGEKGVDDFLAHGGMLGDLARIGREPSLGLPLWAKAKLSGRRGAMRAARAIEGLALHAAEDGTFGASVSKAARVMEIDPRGVQRAIEDLAEIGAVEVQGSLETCEGRFYGRRYVRQFDWNERPKIMVNAELRAREEEESRRWILSEKDVARQREQPQEGVTFEEQMAEYHRYLETVRRRVANGEFKGRERRHWERMLRGEEKVARNLQIVQLRIEGLTWDEIGSKVGCSAETARTVFRDCEANGGYLPLVWVEPHLRGLPWVDPQKLHASVAIGEGTEEDVNAVEAAEVIERMDLGFERIEQLIVGQWIARDGHPVEEAEGVLAHEAPADDEED